MAAFGRRPRCKPHHLDRPSSETLHKMRTTLPEQNWSDIPSKLTSMRRVVTSLMGHRATCAVPCQRPASWAKLVHAVPTRRRAFDVQTKSDPWGNCVLMFWNFAANAWPLVTRQQSRRENAAPHKQAAPAAPRSGAPIIRIEEPNTTRPIRSPVRIRVTFQPASNATIVVNSLRVRYGSLRHRHYQANTCTCKADCVWCYRRRCRASPRSP